MTRTQARAIAVSAIAAVTLLYLGFSAGMISMAPERTMAVTQKADRLKPRRVKVVEIRIPLTEFDRRWMEATR